MDIYSDIFNDTFTEKKLAKIFEMYTESHHKCGDTFRNWYCYYFKLANTKLSAVGSPYSICSLDRKRYRNWEETPLDYYMLSILEWSDNTHCTFDDFNDISDYVTLLNWLNLCDNLFSNNSFLRILCVHVCIRWTKSERMHKAKRLW